jgi:hypothetical protein
LFVFLSQPRKLTVEDEAGYFWGQEREDHRWYSIVPEINLIIVNVFIELAI